MLKELRELTSFVLGFLNEVVQLIGTSRLSTSPLHNLGRDRALSLQLSGVIGIVLVGVFISTFSDKNVKIDLLPFSTITLIYVTVAASVVGLVVRQLRPAAKKLEVGEQSASDSHIDATSYVISFNLVALVVFALARDLANFAWQSTGILWPAALAVAVAGTVILTIGKADSSATGLSAAQRSGVILVLVASFFGYAAALARFAG